MHIRTFIAKVIRVETHTSWGGKQADTVSVAAEVCGADDDDPIAKKEIRFPLPLTRQLIPGIHQELMISVSYFVPEDEAPSDPDEDRDMFSVVGRGSYDPETDELHIEPDPDEYVEDRLLEERDRGERS